MRIAALPAMLAAGLVFAPSALAHPFAPALLELREGPAKSVEARWKEPAVRAQGSRLRPVLPAGCKGAGRPEVRRRETGIEAVWRIECPKGLRGETIGVEGIASSGADVLARLELADGTRLDRVLTADADRYTVPATPTTLGVAGTYGELGLTHILTGWDHVLFVVGLTLLIGWGQRLAWTITAFTVGHSSTLGLAALGVVHVSQRWVEVGIAASLYVLALEIVGRPRWSLVRARPWLAAGLFGLLHGLGFAGALADVGLPSGEIPLALLAFNVGIEVGQLAVITLVLLAIAALGRLPAVGRRLVRLGPAYAIGSLAVLWILQRL